MLREYQEEIQKLKAMLENRGVDGNAGGKIISSFLAMFSVVIECQVDNNSCNEKDLKCTVFHQSRFCT